MRKGNEIKIKKTNKYADTSVAKERMHIENHEVTRRRFLKISGIGATGLLLSATGINRVFPYSDKDTRRVLVASDLHIGKIDDGQDGEIWFARALDDLNENIGPVDYAVVLGDIAHDAQKSELLKYIKIKDESDISEWFELAGNHEFYGNRINYYRELLRSEKPYLHVDGNIVWCFLSDELHSRPGNITEESAAWIKEKLAEYDDKIIIMCSHQLIRGTVDESEKPPLNFHPHERIEEILKSSKIDLWLCGHLHHGRPHSKKDVVRKGSTTYMNIASMSHAYGTGVSQSCILEMNQGDKFITARFRNHDKKEYDKDNSVLIPTRYPIQAAKNVNKLVLGN